MPRWQVRCDTCDAGAWIGPREGRLDGWCEAEQRAQSVEAGALDPRCDSCGGPLSTGELRFVELYGSLQNLSAVLAAWCGDPEPLDALLPDRPRFLTDLNPPEIEPGDPEPLAHAIRSLAAGAFAESRGRLEGLIGTLDERFAWKAWRALGIAAERAGDPAAAEQAFGRAIEAGAGAEARLARGALRARRGDFEGARADLAHAGEGREACWNRAALRVLEAVATTPGLPPSAVLDAARLEAGAPSPYWSEHTVGRLLWVLLAERAEARMKRDLAGCTEERVLHAAEQELEFDSFWDRALVLESYARLGLEQDAARVAAPLALELLDALSTEPYFHGPAALPIAEACAAISADVRIGEPDRALTRVRHLEARKDVRRYRLPCAACGRGTVGVEAIEEEPAPV